MDDPYFTKTIKWCTKAAKQGLSEAQTELESIQSAWTSDWSINFTWTLAKK